MARPKSKELTERELEVMHVFWKHGEQTIEHWHEADAGFAGRRPVADLES